MKQFGLSILSYNKQGSKAHKFGIYYVMFIAVISYYVFEYSMARPKDV